LVNYAAKGAFSESFSLQVIYELDKHPDLALGVEAFTSRFCRLQDTIGDKLLPTILQAMQEPKSPFLVNLNKAEKYGWLNSAEDWIALRQLRNQMVHEYIEDSQQFFDALQASFESLPILIEFAKKLEIQAELFT
jgi:hypothetical protein